MPRIIAVTSGKGGVGKTHLSVNLAWHCARAGLRSGVFDADLGLANANLLLGLTPQRTLADVLAGRCALDDIVLNAFGIDVIPGSSGVEHMADLAPAALARLDGAFRSLGRYDVIVVDTAAGVADNVLAFIAAAPEALLVITPEPTALTDAYALVKLLQRRHYRGRMQVVVNQATSARQAQHTYEKFREVVRVYQGLDLPLLGTIPWDAAVAAAVSSQTPVSALQADSPAAQAFGRLATRWLRTPIAVDPLAVDPVASNGDALALFWERLTGRARSSIDSPTAPVEKEASAVPTSEQAALAARVERLEARVAELAAALAEQSRSRPPLPAASPGDVADAVAEDAAPQEAEPSPWPPVKESLSPRRRAGEAPVGGRSLRSNTRATPIDALQLRRVVGRMLVKAMPQADGDAHDQPVQVAVDQLQLEAGNELNLRPGRYTRIALHCAHIQSPDRFIEEIFANCAITGCKVRHLGSHVRYWVTSGRDGCILLDGAVGERNCVQVYMAAGGNSPSENLNAEVDAAIPRLRRAERDAGPATPERLLGRFPHERVDVAGVDVFRLARRDQGPLWCAFHRAGEDKAGAVLYERSPV